jgi:DNA-directed RNA polymerase subunit RPC12/RpoP
MPDDEQQARFDCLRCGAECELPYTPGKVEERTCPKCGSNSVRRRKVVTPKPEPGE